MKIVPIIKECYISINMDAQSYYSTNMVRRELIRAVMSPKYRDLCSAYTCYTKELFSDNITKTSFDLESGENYF